MADTHGTALAENKNSKSGTATKSAKWKLILQNKYIYIMIFPVMLYYFVFHYFPMYGIILAFKDYKGGTILHFLTHGQWEGFKNFKILFSDALFFRAIKNTLILSTYNLIFIFPLTIMLALLLNEVGSKKIKGTIQTVIYLPHFFSWVIVGAIVIQLLSPDNGAVAAIIQHIHGGGQVPLLMEPKNFRTILIVSNALKEMGFGTVIYIAAISGVSQELYESADLDGASRYQKMWYVTLPSISPTIVIMLLLQISHMIAGNFDQVFMLYNSMVYETGDILDTMVYRLGLVDGRFSFAATVGLFKSVVMATMLVIANTVSRKLFDRGLW